MDSRLLKQKRRARVLICKGHFAHRDETLFWRTSAWVVLISSIILVAFFYMMVETVQTSTTEEAVADFKRIRTLIPNSKLQSSAYLIVSSSCSASIFQPEYHVHVCTAGRFLTFTTFQNSSPFRIRCVCNPGADNLIKMIAVSLCCEEIPGNRGIRGKTPVFLLLGSRSEYNVTIKRLLTRICAGKSVTQSQRGFLRHYKRNSYIFRSSRSRGSELTHIKRLCGDLEISSVLHRLSNPSRQLLPQEGTKGRLLNRASVGEWLRQTKHWTRHLSNSVRLGDRQLRRILADSPGSSGLHGKWRAIVISDTVIAVLGFLLGLSALACCMRKRGASLRCWWNFSWRVGASSQDRDLPDYESSPGTSRPMPPMSSPILYDLRQTLRDFRATSRNDSAESRSRRSQTGSGPLLYGAEAFSLEALEAATGGFAEENKIGSGSFGVVYRGVLFDGRVVAIKRADRGNAKKTEENESAFEAELEVLSRLHHKYLVNLVGFCDDQDERLLVYEYMSNGTVHDHLHRHRSVALSSWQARIRVALQAARGIEYLHTYASRQIIHRDIKSANILLDSKWNARVSDFGLSLISPSEEVSGSHLTAGAAGTLGYMDPEYYRLQHLTTKSDVYSFGVVLMELLTGKKAIHRRNALGTNVSPSNMNVVDYAVPPIRADELLSILDARLRGPEESESAAVEIIAEVAEQCVRPEGKDRPTMAEIVGRLETAHALSRASETIILRGSEASSSSQIGSSRQLDASKLPLDRQKGESLEIGVTSVIPESHEEQDSETQSVPDESVDESPGHDHESS